MVWSYARNGLVIAHRLRPAEAGGWELTIVDFDGYPKTEQFADEPTALRRQMELERGLISKGWGLEVFQRAA